MAEASIHIIVRVCTVFFNLGPKAKAATGKGADSENNANAHLEFGFRLLDRLSRSERGLTTLRRYGGGTPTPPYPHPPPHTPTPRTRCSWYLCQCVCVRVGACGCLR